MSPCVPLSPTNVDKALAVAKTQVLALEPLEHFLELQKLVLEDFIPSLLVVATTEVGDVSSTLRKRLLDIASHKMADNLDGQRTS
jgi:hypothetical protein